MKQGGLEDWLQSNLEMCRFFGRGNNYCIICSAQTDSAHDYVQQLFQSFIQSIKKSSKCANNKV